jgi:hypothetical protein
MSARRPHRGAETKKTPPRKTGARRELTYLPYAVMVRNDGVTETVENARTKTGMAAGQAFERGSRAVTYARKEVAAFGMARAQARTPAENFRQRLSLES